MNKIENFGYLGYNFQIKILHLIIIDKSFANSIIDSILPKYFDNQYFKLIMQLIKDYYDKYDSVPTFEGLQQLTQLEISSEMAKKNVIDTLKEVKESSFDDHLFIKEKTIKFCKQQELQKAIRKVEKILDKGEFESYDKCEEYIRKAITIGDNNDGNLEVFQNIEEVLEVDYRHPIPTGIDGIDNFLKITLK